MKKSEILVTLSCIGIGIAISYGGYSLGLGGLHTPGAGFFPLLIGFAIIALSLLHVINQLFISKSTDEDVFSWPDKKGMKQVGKVFFSLIGYGICLEYLGFIICTFLIMFYLLKFIGRKKWFYSLLVSLIIAACSFYVFERVLKLGLSRGFFGL